MPEVRGDVSVGDVAESTDRDGRADREEHYAQREVAVAGAVAPAKVLAGSSRRSPPAGRRDLLPENGLSNAVAMFPPPSSRHAQRRTPIRDRGDYAAQLLPTAPASQARPAGQHFSARVSIPSTLHPARRCPPLLPQDPRSGRLPSAR